MTKLPPTLATTCAALPQSLEALRLTEQLIAAQSNTPDDAGCMDTIGARLVPLGFTLEWMDSGPTSFRVRNLWAKRANVSAISSSSAIKTLAFAGHTDVVPTGPVDQWDSPPFAPTHRDGKLFGRGASDMKASIAAFVVAVQEFVTAQPDAPLNIAFMLSSDEEGPAVDGTVQMCRILQARGEAPDYCIVGEPTSVEKTGDMIKNGRRGTLSGKLTIKGVQGHIAYPHLARNPIHAFAPAMAELVRINSAADWDAGNPFFPPTSWQISNIHGGTGASNVIPGHVVVDFNFRFCTASTPESLKQRVAQVLQAKGLTEADYDLAWTLGGLPFLTTPGSLVDVVRAAILAETGIHTELSTTGGTSDGRFIAQICPQTIELGPPNATIHKINEHVVVADIEPLKNIYRGVLERLAAQAAA